jgi:hypothetical protein
MRIVRRFACFFILCVWSAQSFSQTANQSTQVPSPPSVSEEIRKSVVFIEVDCLHDFTSDVAQLTPDAVAKMLPEQHRAYRADVIGVISRLTNLRVSMAKLSSDEAALVRPDSLARLSDLRQLATLAMKMAALTSNEIQQLSAGEKAVVPFMQIFGTGFMVVVLDPAAPAPPPGMDTGFSYLVTNRHVAQPGIEDNKPCQVLKTSVMLNRRTPNVSITPNSELVNLGDVNWAFSTDSAVDLAIIPFAPSPDIYDYMRVPVKAFATQEMVNKHQIEEGQPVVFAGLFIQSYQEVRRLEPILRSGTLAMVPMENVRTTLHGQLGQVYYAEIHSFGGNSGSPIFVNLSPIGVDYRLLGVVSGFLPETSDFSLQVTTSFNGKIGTNSGITIVVPPKEIEAILNSPPLKTVRDTTTALERQKK